METVHIIIQKTRELHHKHLQALDQAQGDETFKGNKKLMENLYKACKKYIVQNLVYYKKTVFYKEKLSNEVMLDIQQAVTSGKGQQLNGNSAQNQPKFKVFNTPYG